MTAHGATAHVTAPYVAQLRVYEPLAAFTGAEREHWAAYAEAGSAPVPERAVAREREAALRALAAPVPDLPDAAEQALVTELDGVVLVCPFATRLRVLLALAEFRSGMPDLVADAFVPRPVAERAEAELQQVRAGQPDRRVHLLSSAWRVPLRWFVLVDARERTVRPGAPSSGPVRQRAGRSLVYRTSMSRARRRGARALAVLRRELDDPDMASGVEQLGRWLEDFHPRSLVELDYGGLVHLLDDEALAGDESAADVARALAALGDGRQDEAAAAYARVSSRMAALQAVESAC